MILLNKIIIGLIIAIAIGGGIVVFSNVDELVSPNIEQVSNQISENVVKTTSDVKFTNPLQTYEIDSTCNLAYAIQDNIKNSGSPFKHDKEEMESLTQKIQEDAEKINEEYGDRISSDPEFQKQKGLEFIEQMKEELLNYIMEYNSINPKLRNSVSLVLEKSNVDSSQKMTLLNTMYMIDSKYYLDDPECGKKFHEQFGSETFKSLKSLYGEEKGQEKYSELKDIIYGS